MSIYDNAKTILERVHNLNPNVLVVGASKMHTVEDMQEAMKAGVTVFAENRVQEFVDKVDKIDCNWHFIGRLQTNKVKYLVGRVDIIHSIDSEKLVDEVERIASKKGIIQKILIEINFSCEENKGGVAIGEFEKLYSYILTLPHILVEGIMTVAKKDSNEEFYLEIYDFYAKLKECNKNIKYLSLGMSGDYEMAIKGGANLVRIGSGIFGSRGY